jgi:poly(A) polymerase/tRNA nucleotidyltransferase (CCA-adding enzyme)
MIVRTVGKSAERFQEDGLRILRAIRFATELNFTIDHETILGITSHKKLLENISWERKRDEFTKIIMSPDPIIGIGLMQKLGVLEYVVPELLEGVGCEQKGEHIYDVFEHILHALGHAGEKKWPLVIRLSALFHDIGKPRTRRWDATKAGGKGKYTFYGHEVVGAKMAQKIMERLKYPKDLSSLVVKFVRYHMFFSDTETITLSAVRRTIANVGKENIWDLMNLRVCDRVGTGRPKEEPYRLRMYESMVEEALQDPISLKMLKTDGKRIMDVTQETPGPKIGYVLHALFDEVLDNPEKNTEEYLDSRALELVKLSVEELKALGEAGKEEMHEKNVEKVKEIKKQFKVASGK